MPMSAEGAHLAISEVGRDEPLALAEPVRYSPGFAKLLDCGARKSVWVIARDNHGEGLGEPFAAYREKAAAEDAIELLSNADGTFRLVEVPFRGL